VPARPCRAGWNGKRALVTGGAGFLGSYVVETLRVRERGCREVFVPRSKDYDLTQLPAVQKLYADSRPDIGIHLAARVGCAHLCL
jgi:GDP-L-fucose synthase